MKLERVHRSQYNYEHDSLGEITFHPQFTKQVKRVICHRLINYLHEEIRTDIYQARILACLRNIGDESINIEDPI
jgi:hypothetical protein